MLNTKYFIYRKDIRQWRFDIVGWKKARLRRCSAARERRAEQKKNKVYPFIYNLSGGHCHRTLIRY